MNAAQRAFKNSGIESYRTSKSGMDSKRIKRSKPDSIAPNHREEFHQLLVTAMVQEVDLAALAGEVAKRIVVSGALSVDELASQLMSKHREHLTATLAQALIAELMDQSGA